MRIGIDIRKYFDYGIGTYIQNLVAEMIRQSNDQFTYFTFPDQREAFQRQLRGVCIPESARLYSFKELFSLSRKANAACLDVYHAPHYTLPYRLKVPSVVTIHDIIHLKFKEYFSPLQRAYARTIIDHACKTAGAVLVNSEFTKRELLNSFTIDPAKVVVTYPGVNPQFYQRVSDETHEAFRKKYCLTKPYILYVGSMKPYKNIKVLVAAFEKIRKSFDMHLVFVGELFNKNPEFERFLKNSSAIAAVKQLGKIEQAELSSVYQLAQAVVLPSFYEGFGFPMIEAMASGVPAIGARGSAISEVMGDGGLLFDPYDSNDLAREIELVVGDHAMRTQVIDSGNRQVKKFSYAQCAWQTLDVYRRVAG